MSKNQDKKLPIGKYDDFNSKAYNDDIPFSGIKIQQYPEENTFYKELQNKLQKYVKLTPTKSNIVKKDVMHPRDYQYIINNFIGLYNQKENPKMRLARQGNYIKEIINNKIVNYKANFFVEFPNRKSYHAYEISIELERDATKNKLFKFENSITKLEFIGSVGLSDIKFGVPNDLNNNNHLRFYKDTNKYGEYLFMYKNDEIQNILKEKNSKVDKKNGEQQIHIGTNRNIYQNRFQRNKPPDTVQFISKNLYTQPNKTKGKLQIGSKCLGKDIFDNIVPMDCNDVTETIEYKNNKLIMNNKCLSFHSDGKIDLLNCNNPNSCKPNTNLNNCMNYKFIKYGGLEIDGNNSCLNPEKYKWIGENCETSAKANII